MGGVVLFAKELCDVKIMFGQHAFVSLECSLLTKLLDESLHDAGQMLPTVDLRANLGADVVWDWSRDGSG